MSRYLFIFVFFCSVLLIWLWKRIRSPNNSSLCTRPSNKSGNFKTETGHDVALYQGISYSTGPLLSSVMFWVSSLFICQRSKPMLCFQGTSQSFEIQCANLGDMMNISFAPNISLQVSIFSCDLYTHKVARPFVSDSLATCGSM